MRGDDKFRQTNSNRNITTEAIKVSAVLIKGNVLFHQTIKGDVLFRHTDILRK